MKVKKVKSCELPHYILVRSILVYFGKKQNNKKLFKLFLNSYKYL